MGTEVQLNSYRYPRLYSHRMFCFITCYNQLAQKRREQQHNAESVFDETGIGVDVFLLDRNSKAPFLMVVFTRLPLGPFFSCLDNQQEDGHSTHHEQYQTNEDQ